MSRKYEAVKKTLLDGARINILNYPIFLPTYILSGIEGLEIIGITDKIRTRKDTEQIATYIRKAAEKKVATVIGIIGEPKLLAPDAPSDSLVAILEGRNRRRVMYNAKITRDYEGRVIDVSDWEEVNYESKFTCLLPLMN